MFRSTSATLLFTVFYVQIFAQNWIEKSPLPASAPGRHHPVMFSLGDKGYLLTGSNQGNYLRDFYQYDPKTDQWKTLPDFPGVGRGYAVGLAANGKGYVGFGVDSDGNLLNDLWEFDPLTNQWTAKANCLCARRDHPAMVAAGDKIYVGTGGGEVDNLKDFWRFDIASNTWEKLPDLPGYKRHHPFYFGIGDSVYVGFGHGTDIVESKVIYRDFYRYSPSLNSWSRLADFPGEARVAGTQFSHRGKGYIMHGDGDDHTSLETGEFWAYDPLTDKWQQMPAMPGSGRWAPGVFVIGDSVFVSGGRIYDGSSFFNMEDLWMYSLAQVSETHEQDLPSEWQVFPNPAHEILYFQVNAAMPAHAQARLYNLQGQEVFQISSRETVQLDIPTGNLPGGLYFLKLEFGEKAATLKIVVEHN